MYAPYLLYLIVKFIYATNKKVYHHPKMMTKNLLYLCMWHGDLLVTNLITILALEKVGVVKSFSK